MNQFSTSTNEYYDICRFLWTKCYVFNNPDSVCCECCMLSGRGLCGELITRPEESYFMVFHCVWSRNLVNEGALAHWRLGRQKQTKQSIHAFVYALLIISNPWRWSKIDREMSEFRQIVSKNTTLTLVHSLVLLYKLFVNSRTWIALRLF